MTADGQSASNQPHPPRLAAGGAANGYWIDAVWKVTVLEKVLIVEDEAHARNGLTELVASWGFRAECAEDGVEGLERVRQWSPGIVVTDLKMPRMDGMELLTRVRELEPRAVVIMLTAQGSIASAVEAMRGGAYDYIPKPVDPARLRAVQIGRASCRERVEI